MKKTRFWITAIALALLASGLTFVITYTQVTRRTAQQYAPYMNNYGVARKATEVRDYIDTYFIGEYDETVMEDSIAAAMVEATGDRWSYYVSAKDMQAYYESTTNSYSGIGVTVTFDETQGLIVKEVTRGSPAQEAGIYPDDIITAIEGESTAVMGLDEAKNRIRGELGTTVTITVVHQGVPVDIEIMRRSIVEEVVSYQLMDDGIGYLRIANFDQNCANQTIEGIEALIEQGATSLLFDVRFNPGGLKTELCKVLDYLLPEGIIFQSVDYLGREEIVRSDASCLLMPMAVLINEDSYSAAEFFAAALQEYGVATVVGMQTCGKGYFQNTYPLSDGSALALSSGRYCTPNGVSLAEVGGLPPDIVVDLDQEDEYYYLYYQQLAPEDDEQLQAAVEVLGGKISPKDAE